MAWFLAVILLGPSIGPLIGGAVSSLEGKSLIWIVKADNDQMITYTSWRMMFWLQSGLAFIALVLIIWFLPETIPVKKSTQLVGLPRTRLTLKVLSWINPVPILKLQRYPNLSLTVSA